MKLDSHSNKVLITGINGFTGIHLEKYLLKKGFLVYGTVVGKPTNKHHFQCDIRSKEEVEKVVAHVKPNYVIHIAAISFAGESNASLIYDVNVIGTHNLLEALHQTNTNLHKVIVASSATVYGNQGKETLDESMCPKPVNYYGISKLAMEHLAKTYFDKLNIIITRPFNYTGLGQAEHFVVPKIVSHFVRKCKNIELGNINVSREFNDIRYVLDIYYQLMLSSEKSTIVNISSSKPIKLLEVIKMMEKISNHKIEININPDYVRENEIPLLKGSVAKLESMITLPDNYSTNMMLKTMYEGNNND